MGLGGIPQPRKVSSSNIPAGNRTRGSCLEGSYVTSTPPELKKGVLPAGLEPATSACLKCFTHFVYRNLYIINRYIHDIFWTFGEWLGTVLDLIDHAILLLFGALSSNRTLRKFPRKLPMNESKHEDRVLLLASSQEQQNDPEMSQLYFE